MSKRRNQRAKKKAENKDSILESAETLQEHTLNTESWIEKNSKVIISVCVILALVLGGSYAYRYYQSNQEMSAQEKLFYPQIWFEQDSLDIALNGKNLISGFSDIASKYSSTKAGQLAKYYIGVIYLKKGDYLSTVAELTEVDFDDYLLSARTKELVGDAYSELEDYDLAIKYYLEATEMDVNSTFTLQYVQKVANLYELLNKKEKAIELYKKALQDYPKAFIVNSIKKELSRLTGEAYY